LRQVLDHLVELFEGQCRDAVGDVVFVIDIFGQRRLRPRDRVLVFIEPFTEIRDVLDLFLPTLFG
jgi:hypothetical protein